MNVKPAFRIRLRDLLMLVSMVALHFDPSMLVVRFFRDNQEYKFNASALSRLILLHIY